MTPTKRLGVVLGLFLFSLDGVTSESKFKFGPLVFNEQGQVHVEPAMEYGYEDENIVVTAGVPDVRNGVGIKASAGIRQTYQTSGSSLSEVFQNIEMSQNEASKRFQEYFPVPETIKSIVDRGLEDLSNRNGFEEVRFANNIKCRLTTSTGVGGAISVAAGWKDNDGYRMFGAHALGALGFEVSGGLFVGYKETEDGDEITAIRVNLKFPNGELDLRFNEDDDNSNPIKGIQQKLDNMQDTLKKGKTS